MMTKREILDQWVKHPPSQEIADILNATSAGVCPHGKTYCMILCGVVLVGWADAWEPIKKTKRRQWLRERCHGKRKVKRRDRRR